MCFKAPHVGNIESGRGEAKVQERGNGAFAKGDSKDVQR